MTEYAGRYSIEHRRGEIDRLHIQGDAVAADAGIMLDRIGVQPGWRCLDIGCGPRGITDILSERVGPSGRVVGLDKDAEFLAHGRAHSASNVEFHQGEAYASGLPAGAFDLVHMRFVASTFGDPETLIREAMRLARPGGVVALQEPDVESFKCHPPHPAWGRLMTALLDVFASVGADVFLARRLHGLMRQAGLTEVQYRTFVWGILPTHPMADHLPATVESMRGMILKCRLIAEAELPDLLTDCRKHVRDPGTTQTSFMVAQFWGRKPA